MNPAFCTTPAPCRSSVMAATVCAMDDDARPQDTSRRSIMDSVLIGLGFENVVMGMLDG
ncbi:MAG: hypothetical protein ACON3Z_18385 [Bradymonadia bacterium]